MQFSTIDNRTSDKWLFSLTSAIIFALVVWFSMAEYSSQKKFFHPQLSVLTEMNPETTLEQVRGALASDWQAVDNPVNFGISSAERWVRFEYNPVDKRASFIEVTNAMLDNLTVYVLWDGHVEQFTTGTHLPFHQRPIKHHHFVIPVNSLAKPVTVYVQVQSMSVLKLPIKIWLQEEFWQHVSANGLVMGLFFGLLFAMSTTNLFFFFTTNNPVFLFYTGYIVSVGLAIAAMQGFAYQFLWPQSVWLQAKSTSLFSSAAVIFVVIFSSRLMEVKRYCRILPHIFTGVAVAFAVLGLAYVLFGFGLWLPAFLFLLILTVLFILAVAAWLAYRKVSIARYYFIACSGLLLSVIIASLNGLGVIKIPVSLQLLLVLGCTIEVLLIAFILAISYSTQRAQLIKSNAKALTQERENVAVKQSLIDIQKQAQDQLEYNVQERTLELEIALRELSEANRELEKLNTIDPLTGIRNRRYFDKRLQAEGRRSRREQTSLAIGMIDIDHFKQINDKYGHAVGDECIKYIARTLRDGLKRPSDDVCRYGGEEFCVILPNTTLEGAEIVLEQMRKTVESTACKIDDWVVQITISCGVESRIMSYTDEHSELLKAADDRLYKAKQAGRNRVVAN